MTGAGRCAVGKVFEGSMAGSGGAWVTGTVGTWADCCGVGIGRVSSPPLARLLFFSFLPLLFFFFFNLSFFVLLASSFDAEEVCVHILGGRG